ncbi:hypothetical protein L6V77_30555, partial [Myxococcota bacterium]|nr:hypothetical protein [Myxococcota bacterium]
MSPHTACRSARGPHRARVALIAVTAAWVGACADSTGSTGPIEGTIPEYGQPPIPAGDATRLDVGRVTDAGRTDAATAGDLGAPCTRNEDCASGWCVQAAPDAPSVCTVPCIDETSCPPAWACRVVSNTPPDVVSLCFPPPPDAGVPDAASPDAARTDATVPDAAPPDAAPPDMLVIVDMHPLQIDLGVLTPDAAPPPVPDA